jgi:hypothetical protein
MEGTIVSVEILTADNPGVIDPAALRQTASVIRLNKRTAEGTTARAIKAARHAVDINESADNHAVVTDFLREGEIARAGIIECFYNINGRSRSDTREKERSQARKDVSEWIS